MVDYRIEMRSESWSGWTRWWAMLYRGGLLIGTWNGSGREAVKARAQRRLNELVTTET